jgi:hypothetical protein
VSIDRRATRLDRRAQSVRIEMVVECLRREREPRRYSKTGTRRSAQRVRLSADERDVVQELEAANVSLGPRRHDNATRRRHAARSFTPNLYNNTLNAK